MSSHIVGSWVLKKITQLLHCIKSYIAWKLSCKINCDTFVVHHTLDTNRLVGVILYLVKKFSQLHFITNSKKCQGITRNTEIENLNKNKKGFYSVIIFAKHLQ